MPSFTLVLIAGGLVGPCSMNQECYSSDKSIEAGEPLKTFRAEAFLLKMRGIAPHLWTDFGV